MSDISFIREGEEFWSIALVDFPFSLVADTILLPYTLTTQAKYGDLCAIDEADDPD